MGSRKRGATGKPLGVQGVTLGIKLRSGKKEGGNGAKLQGGKKGRGGGTLQGGAIVLRVGLQPCEDGLPEGESKPTHRWGALVEEKQRDAMVTHVGASGNEVRQEKSLLQVLARKRGENVLGGKANEGRPNTKGNWTAWESKPRMGVA